MHNAATRCCGHASGMESERWSPMACGSESARPKTEEQKWTLLVRCCGGPPPLNEISLWNGKVWKDKGKVRPSVWTKLKEEKEHGEDPKTTQDPWSKSTHMVPAVSTNKKKNRTEDGERPGSRNRSASSLSDMQIEGEQSEKVPKPPDAFEKIAQQETRKEMQILEQTMNQQVLEQNERLKSLGPLITENQKSTENKRDQTEEATRPTQQMQQRTDMMFQQFLAAFPYL